ncbi:hypothetical protein DCO60_09250 [Helicobacter saguini]|uniref:hypothetical protein n=1 Tax=Helicobacter saguini TaxID=1548018 RepID=UPI00132668B3|nr:hypothetical protein [Helicobacter saguini]MWV62600.1 hypothetical protein [Helicobacter saguini]
MKKPIVYKLKRESVRIIHQLQDVIKNPQKILKNISKYIHKLKNILIFSDKVLRGGGG